ncbi:MAG TPA: 2-oxoglutarate dehydrogenase E1 component [Ktedonobacteraceae bacterium]|nr:2-oxoglutarate dehydrogenase E1 component [Ktedonobacteraceae bacterium]
MDNLQTFHGPNAGYVLELYERFLNDPASVDAATRAIFEQWQPVQAGAGEAEEGAQAGGEPGSVSADRYRREPFNVNDVVAASALAHGIRSRGHLGAHLDPLGSEPLGDPALSLETYDLSEADLALLPPSVVGGHAAEGAGNALEAINALRAMYSGSISYEFDQVKSPVERHWLRDAVGLQLYREALNGHAKRKLLQRLTRTETFERFLQQIFPGQKRFSLEGTDVLIPMLDEVIGGAIESGVDEVIIGMAHRGRLNVLAHVLQKPYGAILSEFMHMKHEEGVPLTDSFGFGWTGDVKYHLGAEHVLSPSEAEDLGIVPEDDGAESIKVTLAPNPSHLEFVNAVVDGMVRASQETRAQPGYPRRDVERAIPVVIHGDAAFSGEGIVAETMNLWNLRGYSVGGTIHIIANNQLGFTTEPHDSRSTYFASDLAKGFEIPVIHVNADDPDAALTAMRLAFAYQDHFHKDVLVELVGYRRWGHNEGDEPAFTQPVMYDFIRTHPTVREIYARQLEQEGIVTAQEAEQMVADALRELEEARQAAENGLHPLTPAEANSLNGHHSELIVPSAVSAEQLRRYNAELLTWPRDFSPNPKLARLLQRRANTLGDEGGIDWGQAEALAFASLLAEGIPIRLSGQDSERGTFSHRHAVLHDQRSGEGYLPLQHLSEARASFAIYNSPLSEVAVLGFEYGYSVHAPETLVLWEAQFGDFVNVAQVMIDLFLASGRAKWKQDSSLVLLLPHGYEGQGPDHSSARLERYLELSAQDNWRVVHCSHAGQFYHVLRRQGANLTHAPRPLIVMTPKSLLRHPLASTNLRELAEGHFQPVLDDSQAVQRAEAVRRVVLCSGKVAIDLLASTRRSTAEDVAVVRIEEYYPFPADELKRVLAGYPRAREVVWVQEEPKNMGAWSYMSAHLSELLDAKLKLQVVARPERTSPATGFSDLYQAEQDWIIESAFRSTIKEYGGSKHGR